MPANAQPMLMSTCRIWLYISVPCLMGSLPNTLEETHACCAACFSYSLLNVIPPLHCAHWGMSYVKR